MFPPLIAHLVKFLGHIFHLDKLDYCFMPIWPPDQGLCTWTLLGAPPPDPHHSEEITATEFSQ